MKVKVWLDDIRPAPAGWIRVYWPEEAIQLLKTGDVTEISLDHDLGDHYALMKGDHERTGYDVIAWIEERVATDQWYIPPVIKIHTANPVAEDRMRRAVEAIMKRAEGRKWEDRK